MSVNNVFLVGRLGATPETRVTASGKTVCSFRMATDRWDSAKSEKAADWHDVVAWEKTADNCARFLTVGSQVAVEGRLHTRSYDDKEGRKVYRTEVIAQRVTFLGRSDRQRGEPVDYGGGAVARPTATAPRVAMDDIPF